ncbi:APC family permease [Aeoliella sp. SH292]|uniref:APC family permease n=1 Tax=Aeoliella sp. SH292 TaxID=3454464 RepID=UPI003F96C696
MSTENRSATPLGFYSATALVVASMIGAAVFTSAGFSLAALQSREWVLVAWVVGGAIAVCGAISYGALAKSLRESGGEYVYLARRIHPLAGFLAGWVSLLAGFTGPLAYAATTFELYAAPMLPWKLPYGTIAIAIIALCFVQHSLGVAGGAWLQNAIVGVKIVGLSALLVAGWYWLGQHEPLAALPAPTFAWGDFAQQLTYVYLAYSGFNAAVYVTEEVRDPQTTLPRSMLGGTLLVLVLYMALNAVFVYSGPLEALAGQADIAAVAMKLLGGPTAELCTRLLILTALASSVSALTMSGPRVYAKMAADRLFPLPVPAAGKAPWAAMLLQAVLAVAVVLTAGLEEQLGYLGIVLMLCAAGAVATLFWVRTSDPTKRPAWWQLVAAALFVIAALVLAVLTFLRNPADKVMIAAGVTLVSGVAAYYAMRWWHGARA